MEYEATSSSARLDNSGFKFISTLGSTLLEEAVKATPSKRETTKPEAETKSTICQSWQPGTLATEEAPCKSSEYIFKEKSKVVYNDLPVLVYKEVSDPVYKEVFNTIYEEKSKPIYKEMSEPPYKSFKPMYKEITKPKSKPEPKVVKEKPKKKGNIKRVRRIRRTLSLRIYLSPSPSPSPSSSPSLS